MVLVGNLGRKLVFLHVQADQSHHLGHFARVLEDSRDFLICTSFDEHNICGSCALSRRSLVSVESPRAEVIHTL